MGVIQMLTFGSTHGERQQSLASGERRHRGKIDELMRRLEKMETEKKEAQDLKVVEAISTCEECGEHGHVQKDCPEEAKMLDYMRKGDLPNFRYGQYRPQFNASSSIANSVPLLLTVKFRQPSHEFTFGVGMSFIAYPLVLTPLI
jgi:hypothetical protein